MSQDHIDKIDQLIRKNNIKYKEAQSQVQYENALKQYEQQKKKEELKQYAQIIKEGNRKAIQKSRVKQQMKKKKKLTQRKANTTEEIEVTHNQSQIPRKPRLTQDEKKIFDQTIEARADRLMQQMHLEKINKQLDEEKKKTKLYELNQRCKKIFSKSSEKIIEPKGIPAERMHILKKFEEKALNQIHQLDQIIDNIIEESNQNKANPRKMGTMEMNHNINVIKSKQNTKLTSNMNKERHQSSPPSEFETLFNLNPVLFSKSGEDLLQMEYIPL